MSTHNICFYGGISKIIPYLSPNFPLICSTALYIERLFKLGKNMLRMVSSKLRCKKKCLAFISFKKKEV